MPSLAMPRPVVAFAWGSMSMTRTRLSQAASAVARLIAVVVLPTPPFWLATATIRARRMTGTARVRASTVARLTGYLLQAKNDPPRIGTALAQRRRHFPAFAREGQFLLDPFAFEKQADTVGIEKRRGKIEQPVERRAGSGRHDIDRMRWHRLDAARANRHGDLRDARRFAQKSAFSRIGLDELHVRRAEDRQNEPGQASAATEIDQVARRIGQV